MKTIHVTTADGRKVEVSAKRHKQITDGLRRTSLADGPGLAIVASELAAIETEVYQVQRLPRPFREFIPVRTQGKPWATTLPYRIRDRVGQAQLRNEGSNDIPLVDVNGSSAEVEVAGAHVGYKITAEEIDQCTHLGVPISAEKADAAVEAFEDYINGVAIDGLAAKNYTGFHNATGVTAANATYGNWDDPAQTIPNILNDFNLLIGDAYDKSGTYLDAFAIPGAAYTALATRQMSDTTMTVLDWLLAKNLTTQRTKRPIMIGPMTGLETKGVNSKSRVVGYIKNERYCRFNLPMEITFEAPQQIGFDFIVPARWRFAPTEFPYKQSVRYLDAVLTAD